MTQKTKTSDIFISMQIVRIKTGDSEIREAAVKALLEKGPKVLERMIDSLDESNWQHQQHLVNALSKFGADAVEPLIAKLEEAESMLKIGIAHTLGAISDPRATQPLIAAMRDDHNDVRDATAAALAKIGPRALRALVLALRDSNWRVRAGAASALAILKEKRAMYPLIASLHDPYAQVRGGAARALGEMRDARAVEPLLNALRDSELLVRSQAAVALGRIGDERAVIPLVSTLKNAKPSSVRANAALALGLVGSPRAIQALVDVLGDEARSVQAWASGALVRFGSKAVDPLIKALEDPSFAGRKRGLWALGTLGDPRGEAVIRRLVTDGDEEVRKAAEQALRKLETVRMRAANNGGESAAPAAASSSTAASPEQKSDSTAASDLAPGA